MSRAAGAAALCATLGFQLWVLVLAAAPAPARSPEPLALKAGEGRPETAALPGIREPRLDWAELEGAAYEVVAVRDGRLELEGAFGRRAFRPADLLPDGRVVVAVSDAHVSVFAPSGVLERGTVGAGPDAGWEAYEDFSLPAASIRSYGPPSDALVRAVADTVALARLGDAGATTRAAAALVEAGEPVILVLAPYVLSPEPIPPEPFLLPDGRECSARTEGQFVQIVLEAMTGVRFAEVQDAGVDPVILEDSTRAWASYLGLTR